APCHILLQEPQEHTSSCTRPAAFVHDRLPGSPQEAERLVRAAPRRPSGSNAGRYTPGMTTQIAVKLPDELVARLDELVRRARFLVAPVTRRIRGVPSELPLGTDEGLPVASVASFDNLRPFPKALLVRRLGALSAERRHELCAVAATTLDC